MAYSTVWMPLMLSTAFICPVELTDVWACWSAEHPASIAVPIVMVCYGSTCPQPCCGNSARAVCLARLFSAASAKSHNRGTVEHGV